MEIWMSSVPFSAAAVEGCVGKAWLGWGLVSEMGWRAVAGGKIDNPVSR